MNVKCPRAARRCDRPRGQILIFDPGSPIKNQDLTPGSIC